MLKHPEVISQSNSDALQSTETPSVATFNILAFVAPWLVVLALFGYPMVALIGTALNVESQTVSIPFRIAAVVVSVAFFVVSPYTSQWIRQNYMLLGFWGLYAGRLVWDWAVADAPGLPTADYVLLFFTVACFIPSLALGTARINLLDDQSLSLKIAIAGALTCFLSLAMDRLGLGEDRSLTKLTGRLFFESLNPITLGHIGVSTLIALLCLSRKWKFIYAVLIPPLGAAAVTCILFSGSRGPIVSLAICLAAFILVSRKWFWVGALLIGLVPLLLDADGILNQRLSMGIDDQSTLGRFTSQNSAIEMFQESPVLGSAFADRDTLSYPHNLFIETAMSMGLVGLMLLFFVLNTAFRNSLKLFSNRQILIPLLFLQYLIAIQLSGSIWGSSPLWGLLAILHDPYYLSKDSENIESHRAGRRF